MNSYLSDESIDSSYEFPIDLDYAQPLWAKISKLKKKIANNSSLIDVLHSRIFSPSEEVPNYAVPYEDLLEQIENRKMLSQDLFDFCEQQIASLPLYSDTRQELSRIRQESLASIRKDSSDLFQKLSGQFDKKWTEANQISINLDQKKRLLSMLEELAQLRNIFSAYLEQSAHYLLSGDQNARYSWLSGAEDRLSALSESLITHQIVDISAHWSPFTYPCALDCLRSYADLLSSTAESFVKRAHPCNPFHRSSESHIPFNQYAFFQGAKPESLSLQAPKEAFAIHYHPKH